jgi:hypothetical protein
METFQLNREAHFLEMRIVTPVTKRESSVKGIYAANVQTTRTHNAS